MSRGIRLLATVGVALIATAIVLPRFALPPPKRPPVTRVQWSEEFGTTMSAGEWWTNDVTIEYPSQIKITDSAIVRVVFLPRGPGNRNLRRSNHGWREDKLARDVTLSLSAAAFDIAPAVHLKRRAGTPVPVQWLWTVSPKKEGRHFVALDIDELQLSASANTAVRVNGRHQVSALTQSPNERTLPLVVLTREGLTVEYYLIAKIVLAALGFILLYPAVASWMAGAVRKWRERRTSTIIRP